MIISASYKTDIPAFYGNWLISRFMEGSCTVRNPYNNRSFRVDLGRQEVDGVVFWTRDPAPFFEGFRWFRDRGYPFYVHFTITGYPEILEPRVPDMTQGIASLRELSRIFGKECLVWRYDPLLFTTETDRSFHFSRFSHIASELAPWCNEVVISFAQFYRKTRRQLDILKERKILDWWDPQDEAKIDMARELAGIAVEKGLKLSLCGQRDLLSPGVADASCIDPFRLSRVAGYRIRWPEKRSHRPGEGCGCYRSRDIGSYNTCSHGCIYCYAVGHGKNLPHKI